MALLRIPVLIALLIASGPLQWRYAGSRFELTLAAKVAALPTWIALMVLAVVFVVAAGYRRDRRHATPVLALEAILAFLIVLVPPLIWAQVLPGVWTQAMGGNTGSAYPQMLALVWLLIVFRTFRDRRRGA